MLGSCRNEKAGYKPIHLAGSTHQHNISIYQIYTYFYTKFNSILCFSDVWALKEKAISNKICILYTKIGGVDILVGGAYIRLFRSGKSLVTGQDALIFCPQYFKFKTERLRAYGRGFSCPRRVWFRDKFVFAPGASPLGLTLLNIFATRRIAWMWACVASPIPRERLIFACGVVRCCFSRCQLTKQRPSPTVVYLDCFWHSAVSWGYLPHQSLHVHSMPGNAFYTELWLQRLPASSLTSSNHGQASEVSPGDGLEIALRI